MTPEEEKQQKDDSERLERYERVLDRIAEFLGYREPAESIRQGLPKIVRDEFNRLAEKILLTPVSCLLPAFKETVESKAVPPTPEGYKMLPKAAFLTLEDMVFTELNVWMPISHFCPRLEGCMAGATGNPWDYFCRKI